MNSNKKTARIAGILYLAHFLTFFLADNGVHYTGVEPLDPQALLQSMMSSEIWFDIGFVSFLFTGITFFLSAWALYVLLKPVNKELALLFMLLNLGGISVWLASMNAELAIPFLLSSSDVMKVFQADQLEAIAVVFLSIFKNGYMISQILLNLWLFPLGYVVYKSGFIPRILGILLLIDGVAMLTWSIQYFLFPGYEIISEICLGLGFLAEGSFCLWLLIKGVNDEHAQSIRKPA